MKLNYTEKKSILSVEEIEINLSESLTDSVKTKVENRIKEINNSKELTIEEKTERSGKVTVESYVKRLISDIHNAIISTVILSDKSVIINGKSVNTDKKRINGKSVTSDIKNFQNEIQEFLDSGYVTIDSKKCFIRNTFYGYEMNDKTTIGMTFIDIKHYNLLNKTQKEKSKKSTFITFKDFRIGLK